MSFSQSLYGVMEDDGRVTLIIRLSQPSSVPFQVIVNTMDGTAVGMYVCIFIYIYIYIYIYEYMCVATCTYVLVGSVILLHFIDEKDYSGDLNVVTVPAGEMAWLFTIAIVDDDVMECDETFIVTILLVTTCAVAISNGSKTEVMITDDDGRQNDIFYDVAM